MSKIPRTTAGPYPTPSRTSMIRTVIADSGCNMLCRPRNRPVFIPCQNKRMSQKAEYAHPHLADELLIVRHSGEIPEVALHGSLHFLTCAPDGPALVLSETEVRALKGMVVERYREIIQRDLEPANRDLTLFRGLTRAAVNWRRLEKFCRQEGLALEELREETRQGLLAMVRQEVAEVALGLRTPSINCPAEELRRFAKAVALNPSELAPGWETLCPAAWR